MPASRPGRAATHRAILAAAAVAVVLTSCAPGSTTAPSGGPSATPSATSTAPTASGEPPASGPTPSECPIDWGTGRKTSPGSTSAPITGIRSGRHDCFDRLVIDVNGDAAGFDVRYVAAVTEEGRGERVPLRGSAFLQVVVLAPAYDPVTGDETYTFPDGDELVDVDGFETFRQVAWAGSFEGQTTIGIGVESKLPFRVFALDGPGTGSRVVIDVGH